MAPTVLVCVPVDDDQAHTIARGGTLTGPLQAFAPTAALYETFGLTAADDEEAEFAALLMAGLWCLQQHGRRLVLTGEVPDQLLAGAETENGGITITQLRAADVEAFFSDDDAVPSAELAGLVAGLDLDQAWDLPEIQALHHDHDLMWHSVIELRKD